MGRHTDPAVSQRRATVLTVCVSVLLVAGGVAILIASSSGPTSRPPVATGTPTVGLPPEEGSSPTATPTTTGPSTTTTATTTAPTTPVVEPVRDGAPPQTSGGAATSTASPAPVPATRPRPAPPGRSSMAEQVVSLVNVERSRAGCPAVGTNAALARAAQGHSADMAARGYLSQTSPDGRGYVDRIRAAGYVGSPLAESVSAGEATARAVMRTWMASPGPRAAVLDCRFRAAGVGYATGGPAGTYWTLDLGG